MLGFLRKTALWIVLTPIAITYTGAGLNQLVLNANHDTFPVEMNDAKVNLYAMELQEASEATTDKGKPTDKAKEAQKALELLEHGYLDDTHVIMTSDTHLNFLADVFDFKDAIYSVGDGILYLGEWLTTFAVFIWLFEVIRRLSAKA
jgi:hypothetical protein